MKPQCIESAVSDIKITWGHVMSWFSGKGNVYETVVDRQDFIKTLAGACGKTGFRVHACRLMRNHFHAAEYVA